jgi:hypothetical protein
MIRISSLVLESGFSFNPCTLFHTFSFWYQNAFALDLSMYMDSPKYFLYKLPLQCLAAPSGELYLKTFVFLLNRIAGFSCLRLELSMLHMCLRFGSLPSRTPFLFVSTRRSDSYANNKWLTLHYINYFLLNAILFWETLAT